MLVGVYKQENKEAVATWIIFRAMLNFRFVLELIFVRSLDVEDIMVRNYKTSPSEGKAHLRTVD